VSDVTAPVIADVLTDDQPFGPRDSDRLVEAGLLNAEELFDTSNLVYKQRKGRSPTYIIGRKGAGKTAFLRGHPDGDPRHLAVLTTDAVYADMADFLKNWAAERGVLLVKQTSQIWQALFEHAAMAQVCESIRADDPRRDAQTLYDYIGDTGVTGCTAVAQWFVSVCLERLTDRRVKSVDEILGGISSGGISFAKAHDAMVEVMKSRSAHIVVVMDNLEDLHLRFDDLAEVLQGLFSAAGAAASRIRQPFQLRLCMPSEIWERIHNLSTNPEKDFGGEQLTIYWTAPELIHLAATRYRVYLRTQHPEEYEQLVMAARTEDPVAILRTALPPTVTNSFGGEEDPVAFLLRHTQLLPRHLIEVLNRVFTAPDAGSRPWAVTEEAVLAGTRAAEDLIVKGVLAAHQTSYPQAADVLRRLSNRLGVCFPSNKLHTVFRQEGIAKATNGLMDYRDCLDMLVRMGIVGVRKSTTSRYHIAQFQYTFASNLNPLDGVDDLCFHPLFVRMLLDRSLDELRATGERATYPFGCDLRDGDYRSSLGYRTERS
jgi:hypothetical protein